MAIGKSGQKLLATTEVLGGADSMAYYRKTNELFVADGDANSRIMVYDADTGKVKRMWGAYGNKPLDMDARPNDSAARGLCPTCAIFSAGALPGLQQFSVVHGV